MRRGHLYITTGLFFAVGVLSFAGIGWAQDIKTMAKSLANLQVAADTIWVMVAGFLVFFMHAGFAMLESGLCRAKNTVAILYRTSASSPFRPWHSGFWVSPSCSAMAARYSGRTVFSSRGQTTARPRVMPTKGFSHPSIGRVCRFTRSFSFNSFSRRQRRLSFRAVWPSALNFPRS